MIWLCACYTIPYGAAISSSRTAITLKNSGLGAFVGFGLMSSRIPATTARIGPLGAIIDALIKSDDSVRELGVIALYERWMRPCWLRNCLSQLLLGVTLNLRSA
ncbi:hypothetical protein GGI35DRAFT_445656 [Trichoderma velutinum]